LILSRVINIENVSIVSGTDIYVRGSKSTLGVWLRMDKVSDSRRELRVQASSGRETLEFKDGSGKVYRYKVSVDGTVVTYGDPGNSFAPTFEYLDGTGIRNLGNNLSYDIGVAVAEDGGGGGGVIPVTSDFLIISDAHYIVINDVTRGPAPINGLKEGNTMYVPNSRNGWAINDQKYSAKIGDQVRWVFDLNNFPQTEGQIVRFNLYANGAWLNRENCPNLRGWAQTDKSEWSLAVVYKNSKWNWWQDVNDGTRVPENPQ